MRAFNKSLKYIFATLVVIFSLNSAGQAQVFNFEKNPNLSTVTFPAGTLLKGALQNELSSEKAAVGDIVYLLIPFSVKIGEATCIPKKSLLIGQIIQAQKAQIGRNGFLQIKFDYIKFPDGWGTPLSAHIWSGKGDGVIGGELTKRTAYKKVPHYMQNLGIIAQLVETGQRSLGKERFIPVGAECIIVLDNDLEVKYLEK